MIKLSEIKKRNKINVCSVRIEQCGDGTCDNVTIMSRLRGFYFCRMVSRILLWIKKQTHDTINNRY